MRLGHGDAGRSISLPVTARRLGPVTTQDSGVTRRAVSDAWRMVARARSRTGRCRARSPRSGVRGRPAAGRDVRPPRGTPRRPPAPFRSSTSLTPSSPYEASAARRASRAAAFRFCASSRRRVAWRASQSWSNDARSAAVSRWRTPSGQVSTSTVAPHAGQSARASGRSRKIVPQAGQSSRSYGCSSTDSAWSVARGRR